MLMLDDKTSEIISVIYNMRKLVETNIVSAINIKNKIESKYTFKVIIFITPIDENINLLTEELKNPNFTEYYLFFSSEITDEKLEKIAANDKFNLVKSVIEFNCEFIALSPLLFTLNLDYNPVVSIENMRDVKIKKYMDDILLGLTNFLLSAKVKPDICYSSSIESTQILSSCLIDIFRTKREAFHFGTNGDNTLLLLVDRCQDPITPLLTKWTYQSMIHELIGLKNNVCTIESSGKTLTLPLSEFDDNFYSANMYSNYGFFCESINKYVEDLEKEKKKLTESTEIDSMRKTIQLIPEITKKTEIMNRHMSIIAKLHDIVTHRDLLTVSAIEQKCIKEGNMIEDYKDLSSLITNKAITNEDVLKVALIYILCHETKKDAKIEEIKRMLFSRGIKMSELEIIDSMLKYSGNKTKKNDFFSSFMLYDKLTSMFDTTEQTINLLTQNKPLICDIVEQIAKNKLTDSKYPIHKLNSKYTTKTSSSVYSKVIIFMIGGCTFEEVVKLEMMRSKLPFEIVIGSTSVVNSKEFLSNVASNSPISTM
jgi:vacuolar protein sorting-associated protein 45